MMLLAVASISNSTRMITPPWWTTPSCSTTPPRSRPTLPTLTGSLIRFFRRQIKVKSCYESIINIITYAGYLQSGIPVRLTKFCTELATMNDMPNATASSELLYAFRDMKGLTNISNETQSSLPAAFPFGGHRANKISLKHTQSLVFIQIISYLKEGWA